MRVPLPWAPVTLSVQCSRGCEPPHRLLHSPLIYSSTTRSPSWTASDLHHSSSQRLETGPLPQLASDSALDRGERGKGSPVLRAWGGFLSLSLILPLPEFLSPQWVGVALNTAPAPWLPSPRRKNSSQLHGSFDPCSPVSCEFLLTNRNQLPSATPH